MNTMTMDVLLGSILALVFSLLAGKQLIPYLKRLKFGQEIREDGPSTHQKKAGTPTMGGFIFIFPFDLIGFFFYPERFIIILCTLAFALLGFADDYLKIRKKQNEGLTPSQKFLGQLVLATILSISFLGSSLETIYLPSTLGRMDSLWIKLPLDVLVLLAVPNALNLTDGLDGLAAMSSIPVLLSLGLMAYSLFQPELVGWARRSYRFPLL